MKNTSFTHNRGFTLIELMVGLVVGLVVLLAVTQVYVNWESRQRTTGSKNDAQISGALAAYVLERDLRQAGMGFGSANSTEDVTVGCDVTASVNGVAVNFNFLPVQITNGTDGAPDVIRIFYGNTLTHALTVPVINSEASTKVLIDRSGFFPGDKVVLTSATSPGTCQMVEVTATAPAIVGSTRAFQHLTGTYQSPYRAAGSLTTASMNPAAGTGTDTFDKAFNLGPQPTATVWTVGVATPTRPVLVQTNLLPVAGAIPAALDIAEGIVSLQAQYGYDADDNGQISAAEWFDEGDPALATMQWNRVLAVRYAVLARSRHYDSELLRVRKPDTTDASNPVWAGGKFAMTDIDSASADSKPDSDKNWRAYRYVVYEGVVSLRNVLWGRQL